MRALICFLAVVAAGNCQQHEFGILAGAGLSRNIAVQGASAVSAGFAPGIAAGLFIGHDLYNHWSGEIRYGLELQKARLQSNSTTASFAAQAHTLHYDLVVHSRPRRSHVRPYLAGGAGVKVFLLDE